MDIQKKIDEAEHYPHDQYQNEPMMYRFSRSQLRRLLCKIADEQHTMTLNNSGTENQHKRITDKLKI